MNTIVTAIHGQTVWDLSLQYYGDISAIVEIAKVNDGLSFAQDRLDYQQVNLPDIDPISQTTIDYFTARGRQITTY